MGLKCWCFISWAFYLPTDLKSSLWVDEWEELRKYTFLCFREGRGLWAIRLPLGQRHCVGVRCKVACVWMNPFGGVFWGGVKKWSSKWRSFPTVLWNTSRAAIWLFPGRQYYHYWRMCVFVVAQSCLTLCDPVNCSLPGSSVHGILQARIQEWVAIPFSRGSSQPRDQTQLSLIAGRFFIIWAIGEDHRRIQKAFISYYSKSRFPYRHCHQCPWREGGLGQEFPS